MKRSLEENDVEMYIISSNLYKYYALRVGTLRLGNDKVFLEQAQIQLL